MFVQMGQLVFTRLFYHHMAGELSEEKEFKERLFTYLDGKMSNHRDSSFSWDDCPVNNPVTQSVCLQD